MLALLPVCRSVAYHFLHKVVILLPHATNRRFSSQINKIGRHLLLQVGTAQLAGNGSRTRDLPLTKGVL